jgi:hypothetical protein
MCSAWLLIALLLAICGCRGEVTSPNRDGSALPDVFPTADAVPGWAPAGTVRTYDVETIYALVDGQADAFFAYGFEQVAVQDYENAEGVVLSVEIWQLATQAESYGLFTASISGVPAELGNDADADPGRRLIFWQDRYYVHVRARQEVPDTDLRAFAESVSAALPSSGERPALVGWLPPDGLVERSPIFFHEEISIQNDLWLGGENLLGLSRETDGVLAQYDVGGVTARLLLVQFPDDEAASAGLLALQGGQISGLVAADAREDLLGAVFGEVDDARAGTLLAQALSNR